MKKHYPNTYFFKTNPGKGQGGYPDLIVSLNGKNLLWEIKRGDLPPSGRKLNPKQVRVHNLLAKAGCRPSVVISPEDALDKIHEAFQ